MELNFDNSVFYFPSGGQQTLDLAWISSARKQLALILEVRDKLA